MKIVICNIKFGLGKDGRFDFCLGLEEGLALIGG